MNLAIIIPAYNCPEYILQCYESIKKQIPVPDIEIDIRIGVDGCKNTSAALKGIKHYYSYNNVGAYIIRNSLMKLSPADYYLYFDADDTMSPIMIKRCLENIQTGIVMPAKIQCNQNMIPIKKNPIIESGGAMCFTHNVLEAVGGFCPVRCAADTDFMYRIGMAGFDIHEIPEPLYYRRRHTESLTKKSDTGIGSPYRKKAWAMMTEKRNEGIIKIKPTIIPLKKFDF